MRTSFMLNPTTEELKKKRSMAGPALSLASSKDFFYFFKDAIEKTC